LNQPNLHYPRPPVGRDDASTLLLYSIDKKVRKRGEWSTRLGNGKNDNTTIGSSVGPCSYVSSLVGTVLYQGTSPLTRLHMKVSTESKKYKYQHKIAKIALAQIT